MRIYAKTERGTQDKPQRKGILSTKGVKASVRFPLGPPNLGASPQDHAATLWDAAEKLPGHSLNGYPIHDG